MKILEAGVGKDLLTAFERIDAAADAEGAVPAAVLKTEFRRLGIDAPAEAAVIPVTDEKEPRGRRPESRRFNFGSDAEPTARAYRQIWDWFTRDIEPLADAKQSSLRPIDDTIRALEEERAKPGLSLLDRWMIDTNLAQLRVTRSKINVAFPSSPLDLAALGIAAIGMVQVGNRAIPLFRQGNKVFDADDLANGTWRQAKPIEKLDEYSAAEWRIYLEEKYGAGNVLSTTIPGSESRWFKLRNTQHPETKIWYDERGFAIFDPVAVFDTRLPESVRWSIDPRLHKIEAVRQLKDVIARGQLDRSLFSPEQLHAIHSLQPSVPGYRWHHHQDFGRMQLVPEFVHQRTLHVGGQGMRRGQ